MENHFKLDDFTFENQFADTSLPPELFSHEAHLRLAWIHIQRYGLQQAIDNICQQIQAFALKHGAKDKYHATITVAAVRTVYHFMLKEQKDSFKSFIRQHPRLKNNFKELLLSHYSAPLLFDSSSAKQEFVEPDLLPYDPMPIV